jgi:nucleoside 2-deoxyribosyltransferase
MNRPLVYLAGAIAGKDFDEASDWRIHAQIALGDRNIETLNPLRAKERLADQNGGRISTDFRDYAHNGAFFTSRGIMTRDCNDVRRADALLVNLLGLEERSAGTIMELGWAYLLGKPCIVAIEESGNPHLTHPMLVEAMPFRVTTLDEAIDSVAVLLNR